MKRQSRIFLFFLFALFEAFAQDNKLDSLLKVARSVENDSAQVEFYNQLAFDYIFTDASLAKKVIEEGRKGSVGHKSAYGIALLTNTQGIYMDVIGKSDSANYYFSKALTISRANHLPDIEAKCLNNLGMFHWNRANHKEALTYFFESLELNESLNNEKATANPLNNIGLIYQEMKLHEDALNYHRKALEIREKYALFKEVVASLNNIGVTLKNLGRLDEAIEVYMNGLRLAESSQNYLDYYKLCDNLGNAWQLKGAYDKALNAYMNVLNTQKGNHADSRERFSATNNVIALFNKMGEPKKALTYAERAFELLELNKNLKVQAIDFNLNHAESLYMLNRFKEARQSMETYIHLKDSLFSDTNAKALAALEIKYQAAKRQKEISEQREQIVKNKLELNTKNNLLLVSIGFSFLLGLAAYLFYEQQRLRNRQLQKETELKAALIRIETQNSLQEQRLRISRDLHDNIGSQLTFIISTIDTLKYGLAQGELKLKDQLAQLGIFAKNTINELRDTIWAMNRETLTFEDLHYRIQSFMSSANTSYEQIHLECIADSGIDRSYVFTATEGINMYRIIQESVTNALKYAFKPNANLEPMIVVYIRRTKSFLYVEIRDNGSGFELQNVAQGNGIGNMKKRAVDLDGELQVNSQNKKGTTVSFKIAIRDE